MITKKNSAFALLTITTLAQANFFEDMDAHFKQIWNNFEQDISTATKNGSLSINSAYNTDKNAVIVTIAVPGLTEKDINFTLEDNKMVLDAKTDGRESLVVITEKSILVEQTEYDELTSKKNGTVHTVITGHNRVVNSLPRKVLLHEAQAEYENGVLTITLPSSAKKMAIPVTYKGDKAPPATVAKEAPVTTEPKQEPKKIVIKSKKKHHVATEDTK